MCKIRPIFIMQLSIANISPCHCSSKAALLMSTSSIVVWTDLRITQGAQVRGQVGLKFSRYPLHKLGRGCSNQMGCLFPIQSKAPHGLAVPPTQMNHNLTNTLSQNILVPFPVLRCYQCCDKYCTYIFEFMILSTECYPRRRITT